MKAIACISIMAGIGIAVCASGIAGGDRPGPDALGAGTGASARPAGDASLDLGNNVHVGVVLVPAGKFVMGSPNNEKGRRSNEGPQHEVAISKPFYMGLYEVTRAQFSQFITDSGYVTEAEKNGTAYIAGIPGPGDKKGYSWKKAGFEQGDDHPVVNVSWNDAAEFCRWLSRKTGREVSLPTEAQWEYACRAGTRTAYPWADDPSKGQGWGNFCDKALKKTYATYKEFDWDDGYAFTAPVGKFRPNAFGLYDMVGNVTEWCSDWHAPFPSTAVSDPQGPASGTCRVAKNGDWISFSAQLRSAARLTFKPDHRCNYVGFRVAVKK